MNTEQEKWARSLERWAIPSEILAQSQTSPWILPPARFQIPDEIPATVSSEKALEALPHSGHVLDVGCGGGIASFGLTPRVAHVMGVDHEREMLSMFAQNAEKREISCQVFEGFWPEIADQVPMADVVLCHHVLYNISEIGPFLLGLDSHARSRVVVEMSTCHPLSHLSGAWKHFWNIDRPTGPTSEDVLEVLKEIGIKAEIHYWSGKLRDQIDIDQENDFIRVRLCLPPERLSEVRDYFLDNPSPMHRELATIWWDISA